MEQLSNPQPSVHVYHVCGLSTRASLHQKQWYGRLTWKQWDIFVSIVYLALLINPRVHHLSPSWPNKSVCITESTVPINCNSSRWSTEQNTHTEAALIKPEIGHQQLIGLRFIPSVGGILLSFVRKRGGIWEELLKCTNEWMPAPVKLGRMLLNNKTQEGQRRSAAADGAAWMLLRCPH